MTLGSLFDGSGGFPLAGSLCGIEPKWAAEVEPYPIAVTRSRFPNMKHLGSVTDIHGGEIEPVDVITFGSPCQDLSVAGKRAGLKHEANGDEETTRSGLFMEAVRIIKEMREATNGVYPAFALWENVPGAFSSNGGEDFRTVLEELVKIVEPNAVMPPVPKAGWAYADSFRGDGWSLAYRVFDAQYWGVPQRRRRIHLVLDLRGERAGEVLFEREGVRGYFAQGRTQGQGTAADSQGGTGADDRAGVGLDLYNFAVSGDTAVTLNANSGQSANHAGPTVCVSEKMARRAEDRVRCYNPWDGQSNRQYDLDGVMATLQAHQGGRCEGVLLKMPSYCLQGNGIDRADTAGCNGKGWTEDASYTLNTIDRPAVAYCVGNGQLNQMSMAEQSSTLDCMHAQQAALYQDTVGALFARDFKGAGSQYVGEDKLVVAPATRYIVRRLTPTECARLQGFPDCWGHPVTKDDFTDDEYRFWLNVRNTHAAINGKVVKEYTKEQMLAWYGKLHTDSAEYKMWGNGIALPPALYCMQGIADALSERS